MKDRALLFALVGSPNSGKTALFNALTGARQKVANYAGVTVERKEGRMMLGRGRRLRVLDLPGIYSLTAHSEDEAITRDVLMGARRGDERPQAMVIVADATRMEAALRLALELKETGLPAMLVLNKADVAARRGLEIDVAKLESELGMRVVRAAAVKREGIRDVVEGIRGLADSLEREEVGVCAQACPGCEAGDCVRSSMRLITENRRRALGILEASSHRPPRASRVTQQIDRVFLHPFFGPVLLLALMFFVFQSVFSWAAAPMDMIEGAVGALGELARAHLPEGVLRDLLVDGIIAGVGGVLVFLPQILILYFFIILLEDSGYMARAAFLLDRLMGRAGLHGRSFIPLLSSFACAIPGIMATRVIENRRDRLIVIMIAPLMTCSARIPVYTLLVAAFFPHKIVWGIFNLQGVVFFALYMAGILSGLVVAAVLRRTVLAGRPAPLVMEMPNYQMPRLRDLALGLLERARIFTMRAGTVILAMSVLVWFLSSWPAPPEGFEGQAIEYSFAGRIGHFLAPLFEPLGFDWTITASLIPTMIAREVFVSTISTIYAVSDMGQAGLAATLRQAWSLPVAFAVLAWFVYAPQCVATIAAVRRETNTWGWTAFMTAYLFALAWLMAFVAYHTAAYFIG